MRTLMEIVGVIVWCLAVYTCAYDWGELEKEESGNKFPVNINK